MISHLYTYSFMISVTELNEIKWILKMFKLILN